jgi:hypothetical protein
MSDFKSMPTARGSISFEGASALIDAKNMIDELGKLVTITLNDDTNVVRDEYGSIQKRSPAGTSHNWYSYPITFNPTAKQWHESGLKERTELTFKTSMKDWNDAGYTMERLESLDMIRAQVVINGQTYEIRDKILDSQFQDTWLYVLIGANRK